MIERRSISLGGHRTSVSLEPEFWRALEGIAFREAKSLAALVYEIDRARTAEDPPPNLSSALRVFALGRISTELQEIADGR